MFSVYNVTPIFVLEYLVKFQVIVNLVIDVFKNELSLSIDVTVRVWM